MNFLLSKSIISNLPISKFWAFPLFQLDLWSRCRWSTDASEQLLYIKFNERYLNILDSQKGQLILKEPFEISGSNSLLI